MEKEKKIIKVDFKKYCTNLDKIKEETGLNLEDKKEALEFLNRFLHPNSCFPNEDYFRIIKIDKNYYAPIDEPIADLMIELNKNNYKTMFCCCGHESDGEENLRCYIVFEYGARNYKLISSVIKEITGVTFGEYSEDTKIHEKGLKINEKYNKLLTSAELCKRRYNKFIEKYGHWQQSIGFRYALKQRKGALELINNLIREKIQCY